MELSKSTQSKTNASFSPAAQTQQGQNKAVQPILPIQTKLKIGAPDDIYEKEADSVADKVMRMPESSVIQPKCSACEEKEKMGIQTKPIIQRQSEEDEEIQTKPLVSSLTPFIQTKSEGGESVASESVSNQINASKGSGNALPTDTQQFMESRFGADFSGVRIHTDSQAVQMNKELNAQAFTTGSDIYFNEGKYQPESNEGKRLLAHELVHVGQQNASSSLAQTSKLQTKKEVYSAGVQKFINHLENGDEELAISHLSTLGSEDKSTILKDRGRIFNLALGTFNNKEMFLAVSAMNQNLFDSLVWLLEEGTNWKRLWVIITQSNDSEAKKRVIAHNWMKDKFTRVCNNEEIAEAVDILGGLLIQKLYWMAAEGSDWGLVRKKIKDTKDDKQKNDLYLDNYMRNFFTDVCNNKEMAEAVILLKFTLDKQLDWMLEEGTDINLVKDVIRYAPESELAIVKDNKKLLKRLRKELGESYYNIIFEMIEKGIILAVKDTSLGGLRNAPIPIFGQLLKIGNFDFQIKRNEIRVTVKVKFKFENGINEAAFKIKFFDAIKNTWTNSGYKLKTSGNCPNKVDLPIIIEALEDGSNYHKIVDVKKNHVRPKVMNDINLYEGIDPITIAHEFGHVIGLYDEYDGGFFENIMFWHNNHYQKDTSALMNMGTQLRARYFERFRDVAQKTARTGSGCIYEIVPTLP